MTDLTKIDKPFGELDDETAVALFLHYRRGGAVEHKISSGKWLSKPSDESLYADSIYRAAVTKPSVDWSQVGAQIVAFARNSSGVAMGCTRVPIIRHLWNRWEASAGTYPASLWPSYTPGTCDWKDSLIVRPGVEG